MHEKVAGDAGVICGKLAEFQKKMHMASETVIGIIFVSALENFAFSVCAGDEAAEGQGEGNSQEVKQSGQLRQPAACQLASHVTICRTAASPVPGCRLHICMPYSANLESAWSKQ